MNIIEATKEALDRGIGIRNSVCKQCNNYLLPTNTYEGYFVIPIGYSINDYDGKKPAPRWNPRAMDILSSDWELYPNE